MCLCVWGRGWRPRHAPPAAAGGCPLSHPVLLGLQVSESSVPGVQEPVSLCEPGRCVEEDRQRVSEHGDQAGRDGHVRAESGCVC